MPCKEETISSFSNANCFCPEGTLSITSSPSAWPQANAKALQKLIQQPIGTDANKLKDLGAVISERKKRRKGGGMFFSCSKQQLRKMRFCMRTAAIVGEAMGKQPEAINILIFCEEGLCHCVNPDKELSVFHWYFVSCKMETLHSSFKSPLPPSDPLDSLASGSGIVQLKSKVKKQMEKRGVSRICSLFAAQPTDLASLLGIMGRLGQCWGQQRRKVKYTNVDPLEIGLLNPPNTRTASLFHNQAVCF